MKNLLNTPMHLPLKETLKMRSIINTFATIILVGIVFLVCYLAEGSLGANINLFYAISAIIVTLSLLQYAISTSKLRKDLRAMDSISREVTVTELRPIENVEAGSGMLYIPILGNLFPKLWGQNMNSSSRLRLSTNEGEYFDIDSNSEVNVGDKLILVIAKRSNTLLEIRKQ